MRPVTLSRPAAAALVLLLALLAGSAAVPVAAAQEDVDDDRNETTVEMQLDENVRVLSTDYQSDGGILEVEVENTGDFSETVVVAEVVERGSESWGFQNVRLQGGETATIRMEGVEDRDGEQAVMIATMTGIENENVEWIATGESSDWFDGPATWGLTFLGVIATFTGTFWGVKRYLDSQDDEQEKRQVEAIR